MNHPIPTIESAALAIRQKKLSSFELTQACLQRSHQTQDSLGSFVTLCDETALAAARQADQELAQGIDHGPLHGIPIGIKDIIATADAPSTANSNVLDPAWGQRPDATVVRKLRQAGAVILGKTGLHEFALGWPDPETGFRVPRNPWDLSRSPGGSSSGTGAAVAAGVCLAGLGTDTGGSIRGPASFCGISGHKPTSGRVSKEGCVPLGYSLDNIGPMTRTARDCALLMQVLSGYDPADPCSVAVPVPNMLAALTGSLQGIKVGVPMDYFFSVPELDPEVKASVLAAVEAMRAAGAEVVEVQIPHAAEATAAQRVTMLAEAYAYHEPDLKQQPERYGRYTREVIRMGAFFSNTDYIQAQRLRPLIRQESAQALHGVDVLITPTMLSGAPTFDNYEPSRMIFAPSMMGIWNITGFPALSIPCGFTSLGLPIGLQIIGLPFEDAKVMGVADAYQQITTWHEQTPPLFFDVLESSQEVVSV